MSGICSLRKTHMGAGSLMRLAAKEEGFWFSPAARPESNSTMSNVFHRLWLKCFLF